MLWGVKGTSSISRGPHIHDMHEFFVCLNDSGYQHFNGKRLPFEKGKAFMLYSGSSHIVEGEKENPAEFCFVCFDQLHFINKGTDDIQKLLEEIIAQKHYSSFGEDGTGKKNIDLCLELVEECQKNRPFAVEKGNALLTELLVNYYRGVTSFHSSDQNEDFDRIKALCSNINKNPEMNININQAARKTAMSRTRFIQRFRQHTGMSFIDYQQITRIKKAIELFSKSDIPIDEAAYQSGFNNLGHFNNVFKKVTAHTPAKFKKIVKNYGPFPKLLKVKL